MRSKIFDRAKGDRKPEPFPNPLQDALFTDDYELQVDEQQAFAKLMDKAARIKAQMQRTLEIFERKGGRIIVDGGLVTAELGGQFITVSADGGYDSHFIRGSPAYDRRLLDAALRAELCRDIPDMAMSNIDIGRQLLLNIHLKRGFRKVAEENMRYAANLDELSRGFIAWDDDDIEDGEG